MQIGQPVKIKAPFDTAYSETYVIIAISQSPDTYKVDVYGDNLGADFYIDFLEAA